MPTQLAALEDAHLVRVFDDIDELSVVPVIVIWDGETTITAYELRDRELFQFDESVVPTDGDGPIDREEANRRIEQLINVYRAEP